MDEIPPDLQIMLSSAVLHILNCVFHCSTLTPELQRTMAFLRTVQHAVTPTSDLPAPHGSTITPDLDRGMVSWDSFYFSFFSFNSLPPVACVNDTSEDTKVLILTPNFRKILGGSDFSASACYKAGPS
jgi:hypothetical protein